MEMEDASAAQDAIRSLDGSDLGGRSITAPDTTSIRSEIFAMGDKGSKDKGKREKQKKAQRTPKEKRRLKREKKNK